MKVGERGRDNILFFRFYWATRNPINVRLHTHCPSPNIAEYRTDMWPHDVVMVGC